MSSHINNKRYRDSGGKKWIEVRVPSTETLFDHRDPSPFRAKDLDDDFVEYIYSSSREFPIKTPLKIVIYIDEEDPHAGVTGETIREAIQSHLSYLIDLQTRNMKSYWKRAQFFLAVGLLFLFSCLGLAQNIPVSENPNMTEIFREGLIIFGWVSIWKPIEVILFDWYQPYEDLKYYKKLKKTEIDIYFESSGSQTTVSAKDIYSA